MNDVAALLTADAQRRQAMIDADGDSLMRLLSPQLSWVHSSGALESRSEFIAAITAGDVVYQELEVAADQVRAIEAGFVHSGTLTGWATRDSQLKQLHARFLAVWQINAGQLQLLAWQSTNSQPPEQQPV